MKGLIMQNQMYGCDIESFVDSVVESITYQACGANMVVAGLMSDAQEQMSFGDTEGARDRLHRLLLRSRRSFPSRRPTCRGRV